MARGVDVVMRVFRGKPCATSRFLVEYAARAHLGWSQVNGIEDDLLDFGINRIQDFSICKHEEGTCEEFSISTFAWIVVLFWMEDEGA